MSHFSNLRAGLALLIVCAGQQASAATFFEPCAPFLQLSDNQALSQYLSEHPRELTESQCFRLNRREFLLLDRDTAQRFQGIYYFNAQIGQLELVEGRSVPGIRVVREFDGPNGKHHVLIAWSLLSAGDWRSGYSLLYLTPRRDGYPFKVRDLLSGAEDPELGLCKGGKLRGGDKAALKIDEPRLVDEAAADTRLVFPVTMQDCKTRRVRAFQRSFAIDGSQTHELALPLR